MQSLPIEFRPHDFFTPAQLRAMPEIMRPFVDGAVNEGLAALCVQLHAAAESYAEKAATSEYDMGVRMGLLAAALEIERGFPGEQSPSPDPHG